MIIHFVKRFLLLMCRCKVFLASQLMFLLLSSAAVAQTYPSTILEVADKKSPEVVSEEQINEWIAQVERGDWWLGREFAAAYLRPDVCTELPYGYRCKAMAAKPEVGRKALFDFIDSPVSDVDYGEERNKNSVIKRLQRDYALIRLKEAHRKYPGTPFPNPDDPACLDFIKYISLAAENGALCAPDRASGAYWDGICIEKDKEKAKYFGGKRDACPMP